MRDPIADLKHELLAAAERQQRHAAAGTGRGRWRLPLGRYRLLLAATVTVAAGAALFVSSPWKTAPGFLGRVHAAVAPPSGSILHVKWELTSTARDLGCTVTHGPNEIWIDQTPPHRFRVLLNERTFVNEPFGGDYLRALACSGGGTTAEIGGTFDPDWTPRPPSLESGRSRPTLRFVPPNTLSFSYANWPFYFDDPVVDLREWLTSGRAHDEGTMQLDGRTVRRIRIDPPSDCPVSSCPSKPNYAYVDPESFYPVQIECEDCGGIALPGRPILRLHMVTHFLAYEPLLPRTAANLALTNIRAQHPNAIRSSEPAIYLPKLSGAVAKTVRAAKGAKGARVTFEVTATASDGGDIDVSCLPRSGSRFPLGKTIVHCEATDAWTSTNTTEFTVTVKGRR
jgi:HYR domain